MTERQRDYGKVISIAVMAAIILLGVLSSCTVYRQPQMKITSVLAVTAEGDTLKLDIDPKSHSAWTGGSQKILDKGRVSKYNKKFVNLRKKKD